VARSNGFHGGEGPGRKRVIWTVRTAQKKTRRDAKRIVFDKSPAEEKNAGGRQKT